MSTSRSMKHSVRRTSTRKKTGKFNPLEHYIEKELNSGRSYDDIELIDIDENKLLEIVIEIISKEKKIIKQYINIVKYYINKYTKYKNVNGDKNYLLKKLSLSLKPEYYEKNTQLFHIGDVGDKFFLILKGTVSIIITQEISILLTEQEYNNYLQNLLICDEFYLLNKNLEIENITKPSQKTNELIRQYLFKDKKLNKNSGPEIKKNVNTIDFIDRIKPKIDSDSSDKKYTYKILIYKNVATLKNGESFGETALKVSDDEEKLRTATVITEDDCIFGTIQMKLYCGLIRQVEEKNKSISTNKVLQHTLFKNVLLKNFFKYHYMNYFTIKNYYQGNFLFKQGEKRNALYFINDGIIELYTNSSFLDLANYIIYFEKSIKIKEHKVDHDYDFIKSTNIKFDNYYKKIQNISLYKINVRETLGYEDYIDSDGNFFLNAKIVSQKCQVYILEVNFLKTMLKDIIINKNYMETNLERKKIMINRLKLIRKTLLDKYIQSNQLKSESLRTDINDKTTKFIDKNRSVKILKNKNNFSYNASLTERLTKAVDMKNLLNQKNNSISRNKILRKNNKNLFILNKNNNIKNNKTYDDTVQKKIKAKDYCIQNESQILRYFEKNKKSCFESNSFHGLKKFKNGKNGDLFPNISSNINKTKTNFKFIPEIKSPIAIYKELSNPMNNIHKIKNNVKKNFIPKLDFLAWDRMLTSRESEKKNNSIKDGSYSKIVLRSSGI